MDIIRTIIELSGENIIKHIENLIIKSDNDIKNLLTDKIGYKNKIKILIENTFLFDTYNGVINLMNLINTQDIFFWKKADSLISEFNIKFNTNKDLLSLIIGLIEKTDDKYENDYIYYILYI